MARNTISFSSIEADDFDSSRERSRNSCGFRSRRSHINVALTTHFLYDVRCSVIERFWYRVDDVPKRQTHKPKSIRAVPSQLERKLFVVQKVSSQGYYLFSVLDWKPLDILTRIFMHVPNDDGKLYTVYYFPENPCVFPAGLRG